MTNVRESNLRRYRTTTVVPVYAKSLNEVSHSLEVAIGYGQFPTEEHARVKSP